MLAMLAKMPPKVFRVNVNSRFDDQLLQTSHIEVDELSAAKNREDWSGHEEECEPIEKEVGDILVRETRGCDGPPEVYW